jgi:hypothetical protein
LNIEKTQKYSLGEQRRIVQETKKRNEKNEPSQGD